MIALRFQEVRERMGRACRRAGRDLAAITLVAVTKQVAVAQIREAIAAGARDLGENRVQEAQAKHAVLGSGVGIRWHLVGHLQSNKAKRAVELFDVIHSADSLALVNELARRAAKPIEIFVQVNIAGEAAKSGCTPDEALSLCTAIAQQPQLRLRGLMAIPPFGEDPETSRPYFRQLRALRDAMTAPLRHCATAPLQLSMGMSHDFEVAIEEGADVVRIGTAIFGPRITNT